MMLMAYSVVFFLTGLTLYVCTPFFNDEVWTDGAKVNFAISHWFCCRGVDSCIPNILLSSIFYLEMAGISAVIFICCSFWAYKFIDLDKVVDLE